MFLPNLLMDGVHRMTPNSAFDTKVLRTPAGRMAYTDVGSGPPVVLLHGNPTSAHLYRALIEVLAPQYRCIAPDYLGFGRSEDPPEFSYRPPAHATVVESLLRRLDLTNITLVLHDWGGPIGLAYALRHPSTVERLVLTNTWAWPLDRRPLVRVFSGLVGTPVGRLFIERANVFPRIVMPLTLGHRAFENGGVDGPSWLKTYAEALDTPVRRRACWMFARGLLREARWLRALWTCRFRLRDCSALLCWGMADPAFGTEATLRRWQALFSQTRTHRWSGVGHYVPEEVGPDLAARVQSFLGATGN